MPIVLAHTTDPATLARDAEQIADQHDQQAADARATRDGYIRQLRASDPTTWTIAALARAVGITEYQVTKALRP